MTVTETVIEKMKKLPGDKQQEVLDFVEFLEGRATRRPRRKSCKGVWSDLGIDITDEDIVKARQEMWGQFPRENRRIQATGVATIW